MSGETCPSENELADYVTHAPRTSAIEPHLDGCPMCRATAARMAALAFASEAGSASTPAPPAGDSGVLLSRGDRAGRYEVIEVVGAGAMGTVYAAHDPDLDRTLALKVLRPELGRGPKAAELKARLAREARALARISHPNVITVYDTGVIGDQLFVAMELVAGGTLRSWLRDEPRSWREVLDSYLAAGRGLAAAHAAGIIHRDFKPDNVLVGADGRVRVTDFGLSRAGWDDLRPALRGEGSALPVPAPHSRIGNGSSLTATGALVGTPVYMAPEQLAGGAASARSDLFSFCVALYEGLYGERPFSGSTLEALRRSTREPVPPPPARARVPPWIRRVLLRGLRADLDARYPSMTALLHALSHEPVLMRSWRAPLGVALAGVLGAAAVLALGLVSRPASRATAPPSTAPHPAASASLTPTSTAVPPTAEVPGPHPGLRPTEPGSAPGLAARSAPVEAPATGSSSPAAPTRPAGKPVSPVKRPDRGETPAVRGRLGAAQRRALIAARGRAGRHLLKGARLPR